ncbi:MAG: MFS transporter [Ruminococcaceae bacterium]|nr:MFS transporter [Oscillospiraceae bacterium]
MLREEGLRPFGVRDKIGYLLGDLGNDFTFLLASSFLLKFYTDVMGVSPLTVGLLMMVTRFLDAFTDVAMGRICDHSRRTAAGKFKPWLRRMCVPVALLSFLLYPAFLAAAPTIVKVVWLFGVYILWGSVCYTAINIPYGSMASAISPEAGDRQSLSTWRTMGGMFAGVAVSVVVPLLAYDTVGTGEEARVVLNGGRFMLLAGVFSLLAVACYLLCYRLVTERVRVRSAEQKPPSFLDMIKNAVKNRALISIIAASVVMLFAQLTLQSMAGYVFPNYYRNAAAQSASTLVMGIAMAVAAAVAKPLAARFGKAEISAVSNVFAAAVSLALWLWRPQNVWVYVAVQGLCWLGLGLFSMVSWALITDVIDHAELKNGVREDGAVYALYSFARKLGQAAAAGFSGVLLGAVGYSEATAFDPAVTRGIFTVSTLVPAIGFLLLAAVLWFWYPLHKRQVQENTEALKQKHNE